MGRLCLAGMVLLLAAADMDGGSADARLRWNTIIENVRHVSPSGRYVVVMRQFPSVPDLKGRRADSVFGFSLLQSSMQAGPSWVFTHPNRGHYEDGPAFPAQSAALYDGQQRLATFRLDYRWRGGEVLVADSGRYVAFVYDGPFNNELSPALSIYGADGQLRGHVFHKDLLTPADYAERFFVRLVPEIREHDPSGRDLLLLTTPESSEVVRIDLVTGKRLDALRDVFPPPRTWATPAGSSTSRARFGDLSCVDGAAVPANAIALGSAELMARAIESPLPEYPRVARQARVQGTVSVEVIVSESGEVLCARTSALPFGLAPAAEAAARRWRFTPYLVNGQPVKVQGVMEFHFYRAGSQPRNLAPQ